MRFIIAFLTGLIIGILLVNQETVVKTEWKEKVVRLPARVDTLIKPIVQYRTVVKKQIIRDTVRSVDTVYINTRTVRTRFIYEPKEFYMIVDAFADCPVDSITFRHKMREAYINSIISKPYPTWKKAAWFAGGALLTIWLVK